jgi:hypothetical protein
MVERQEPQVQPMQEVSIEDAPERRETAAPIVPTV